MLIFPPQIPHNFSGQQKLNKTKICRKMKKIRFFSIFYTVKQQTLLIHILEVHDRIELKFESCVKFFNSISTERSVFTGSFPKVLKTFVH